MNALRRLALSLFAGVVLSMTGCEPKEEKVLDIETPSTDIEVTRDKDDGNIDVDVDER